jgi:hypothetical protein
VSKSLVVRDIKDCARCGLNHPALEVRRFERPVVTDGMLYEHWAMCPATEEPLLVHVEGHYADYC